VYCTLHMSLDECFDSLIKVFQGPRHVCNVRKVIKHLGGNVTAQLYENCVVLFMWFCVSIVEFVFGVLERRVTESEPTVGSVCYNNVVMWGFVSVC